MTIQEKRFLLQVFNSLQQARLDLDVAIGTLTQEIEDLTIQIEYLQNERK